MFYKEIINIFLFCFTKNEWKNKKKGYKSYSFVGREGDRVFSSSLAVMALLWQPPKENINISAGKQNKKMGNLSAFFIKNPRFSHPMEKLCIEINNHVLLQSTSLHHWFCFLEPIKNSAGLLLLAVSGKKKHWWLLQRDVFIIIHQNSLSVRLLHL